MPTGSSSRTSGTPTRDHGRPGDRVPLHGAQPGRRGRDARHVHAQAVLAPHRQRPAHAPQPVGRDGGRRVVRRSRRGSGVSGCRAGVLVHRGLLDHAEALAAVACPTVNSYKRLASAGPELRCGLVAGLRHLRRQRPHAHAAGARPRPGGGPLHRRLGQPVPDDQRARSPPGSTAWRGRPTRETRASSTCWRLGEREAAELGPAVDAHDAVARGRAPRSATRCCARAWARPPRATTSDYFVATKRAEVRSSHAEVTPWELDRYLQAF